MGGIGDVTLGGGDVCEDFENVSRTGRPAPLVGAGLISLKAFQERIDFAGCYS